MSFPGTTNVAGDEAKDIHLAISHIFRLGSSKNNSLRPEFGPLSFLPVPCAPSSTMQTFVYNSVETMCVKIDGSDEFGAGEGGVVWSLGGMWRLRTSWDDVNYEWRPFELRP